MNINIKLLDDRATLPVYATEGAACFDIACIAGAVIQPHGSKIMRTGLALEIPDGHVMLIFSRSGHGFKHDTRLSNCVGVIDSDFRGEIKVKLRNDGESSMRIKSGDRVAQGMLMPVFNVGFTRVSELKETERGDKGFGSTGSATFTNEGLRVGQRVKRTTDGMIGTVTSHLGFVIIIAWDNSESEKLWSRTPTVTPL